MNKIFVGRDTQQLGQFTEEEIRAGLQSQQFLPTDLWWKEGMEKWELLSTFANTKPPELPSGGIPWEDESLGLFERFWKTSAAIFIDPWKTFAQMPTTGGYGKPLLYATIAAGLPYVVLYGLLFFVFLIIGLVKGAPEVLLVSIAVPLCFIPLAIAVEVLFFFIGSGVMHLMLMLFGAPRRDFEVTFRTFAYSHGLFAFLYNIVPCLSTIVAMTWGMAIQVIALKETYRTDYWRVICAFLLPILLCCFLYGGLVGLGALLETFSNESACDCGEC